MDSTTPPQTSDSDVKPTVIMPVKPGDLDDMIDLSPNGDRGILKRVIKEGNPNLCPCDGDKVIVHYVGTYYGGDEHGHTFDSSRERNEKFEFKLGKGDVIKAWDIGVASMKIGEVCELIAAPDYAYMDGKTLKFEIEVFDSFGSDVSIKKDGSIRKSVLKKGRDILNPVAGAEASIKIRGLVGIDGEYEVTYTVGDPAPNVPGWVDQAVRRMELDEVSRISTSTKREENGVMVDNPLACEVTLKSFEKTKHLSSISTFPEQMAYANALKTKANDFLKNSKFEVAVELYERLDEDLQYVIARGVQEQKELNEMVTAIRLNLALGNLKLNNPSKCMEQCRKVLEDDVSNEKALYRMAQACILRKDHEEAIGFLKKIVDRNPSNSAAVRELRFCQDTVKKAEELERKLFKSAFERCKQTGLGDPTESEPEREIMADGEKSAC